MNKIEAIKNRVIQGYTLSIYGTRELLYEQMEDDISSLLILFDAQKKSTINLIENIETDLDILPHYPSYIGELGKLKQNSVINLSNIIEVSNKLKSIRKNLLKT